MRAVVLALAMLAPIGAGQAPNARTVAPGQLQQALALAHPGDVLQLAAGTHPGPIRIDKPVTLIGEPGAAIVGPGHGTTILVVAESVTLRNLRVEGAGADLSADDAAILLQDARRVTVRGCDVRSRAFGVYLRGGGEHTIASNTVIGDPQLEPNRRGNGIHLWHSGNNRILDNQLQSVRDGVYLSFAHDNLIARNHGSRLRYGIHYMYSEHNRLQDNRFDDGVGGIALMYSKGNTIAGNEAVGNRDFGILALQLEQSLLSGNRLRGNGRGLFVENSAGNRFLGNHVLGNGVGVYLTGGSEANAFSANAFVANLVQVYRHRAGGNRWSFEGTGNYWSDYGGFDWNGDGVGDRAYRLERSSSALLARYPRARWFAGSPALMLLDWFTSRVGGSVADALDPAPLVRMPATPDTSSDQETAPDESLSPEERP